jgi:hypothetical protein
MADMRIEIGFAGGGSTVTTIGTSEWGELEAALQANAGSWMKLPAKDDEEILLNTSQVVFVRVNAVLRQVGFAGMS